MNILSKVSDFYYKKFVEWQRMPSHTWFGHYILDSHNLMLALKNDPKFSSVREFMEYYTTGKNSDFYTDKLDYRFPIESESTADDILHILVAQTFRACEMDEDRMADTNLSLLLLSLISTAMARYLTLVPHKHRIAKEYLEK